MEPRTSTTREPSTRERILAAAIRLLQETPWTEIRLAEIAELAGTQPSVVIRYFGNKQSLFNAIAQRSRLDLAERMQHSSSLGEALDRAFDYVLDRPWVARLFAELVLNRGASEAPGPLPTMDLLTPLIEHEETKRREHAGRQELPEGAVGPSVHPRLLVFLAFSVMGGWVLYEDYVTSFFVRDIDRETLRAQVRRIMSEMVHREIVT